MKMRACPVVLAAAWFLAAMPAPAAAQCDPDGDVQFVCGPADPEDLAALPESPWVIVSSMANPGQLFATDTRDLASRPIFPLDTSAPRHDTATYGACPGPDTSGFQPHGLGLRAGADGMHTLYVVRHGAREAVEVFEVDASGTAPTATWVGCAVAPEGVGLNSVAALPGGGFVATNFQRDAGELWEWQPGAGWSEVPGSATAGPNGIEASSDGRWLYIGGWGTQSLIRLSRGQTPVVTDSVDVGFHIDNVHFAPDGSLLAAGHAGSGPDSIFACLGQGACDGVSSRVARVDPESLAAEEIVRYPSNELVILGTVGIQVGDEIWVGGVGGGDRIARFPASTAPLVNEAGEVREEAYDHLRRSLMGPDRVYERIDGRRLKGWLNDVVAFSRRSRDDGNRYWGRISGTPYERMTADWTEERFRELGMENIHQVEFELGPQWFPTDWTLRAESGDERISFGSANPATRSDSIAEPISAEAVWVGLGTEADFAGRDVAGKAVIIQTILAPGQMGNSASWEGATKRAEEGGAALIVGIWGYAGNMAIWQSLSSFQMLRDPDGTARYTRAQVATPGFFMGFEDGRRLRDMVAGGETVRISAALDTETREGLSSPSVFGTLPGTTDETILVMAHMDGYYDAALDNASGMAVMIGLADYFAAIPQEERRRSITFIGTAGHHVGSPNAPYLRDQGMLENAALMVNCEHVAPTQFVAFNNELRLTNTVSPRRWWVHGSQALLDIVLDAYDTFGVTLIGAMDGRATGEMMAIDKEAPSVQLIRSPEHKHTDWDIPELVPAAGIEAVTRAFARIIDRANTLDLEELRP